MNKIKSLLLDVANNRNFKYGTTLSYKAIKIWKEVGNIKIVKHIYNDHSIIEIKNLKTNIFVTINQYKVSSKRFFSLYNITTNEENNLKQNIKFINMILRAFCGYKSVHIDCDCKNTLTIKYKVFNKIAFESMIRIVNVSPIWFSV